MRAKELKVGDRFLHRRTKEVFMFYGSRTDESKVLLQDDFDEIHELSLLTLNASYKYLDWKSGDIIESGNLLAQFKGFSTYSVSMAVCSWVNNKITNSNIEDVNEVEISSFKRVKDNANMCVGIYGLKETFITDNDVEKITLEAKQEEIPNEMKEAGYDFINPNHYKNGSMEVIDMMKSIWGVDALIKHCEMTAFKYRMRAGLKPDQSIERDLEKATWYETKAKKLRNELSEEE